MLLQVMYACEKGSAGSRGQPGFLYSSSRRKASIDLTFLWSSGKGFYLASIVDAFIFTQKCSSSITWVLTYSWKFFRFPVVEGLLFCAFSPSSMNRFLCWKRFVLSSGRSFLRPNIKIVENRFFWANICHQSDREILFLSMCMCFGSLSCPVWERAWGLGRANHPVFLVSL